MTLTLDVLWYLVIIFSMIFYAMLDGFDLGVGAIHLFARKDEDRRLFINSIGPLWDGNEVWLVIIFGALFAGFPSVYACLLTGFYNLVMVFIAGLIFRAVAIEFRSKRESKTWRLTWDIVFSLASIVIGFGVGMMLGNLVEGIPMNGDRYFIGSFASLFGPYSLLVGMTTLSLFAMHGAIYLAMKTEGALHDRLRPWVVRSIFVFVFFYVVSTISTVIYAPHMLDQMKHFPWLFIVPVLALLAIINIIRQIYKGNDGWAFLSSCTAIALLLSMFAIGTFPALIRSTINPEQFSLTITNSASSPLTLKFLLGVVAVGIPLVFAYGFYVYHIFRGKVKLDEHSY